MKMDMICGTWIKPEDEIVLKILEEREVCPTIDELMGLTGLSKARIKRTLSLVRQQERLYEGRKKFLEEKED